jgi:hypothetical protein
MSQPVKVSDNLLLDARLAGESMHRSIAGQVEYWAALGRAIEPLLLGHQAMALAKSGSARPLSECLATVDTPEGRKKLADYLATEPFPHYEPAPGARGLLVKIDADGTRTVGRFVRRRFVAVKPKKPRR